MGVKVAYTSPFLQWAAHPSSSSQTLASRAISSPSKRRHNAPFPSCQRLNRSALFGTPTKLHRSKSCELWQPSTPTRTHSIRRVSSASLDPFWDEEFSKKIQELTLRFHDERKQMDSIEIEMKANSVDLPLSIRMIKKKRKWEEGVKKSNAFSSMSKAFSSMVFMIRELQSFTLHMREVLFYEDLQGILLRVREEMHASFVWLFQQVFSATPTLMVYVMILLANFTVYSISSNSALAAAAAAPPPTTTTVTELTTEKFDSSSVVKTFFVSSPNGNTASLGGNNNGGGGGNIRPVLSGTDGDDGSEQFRTSIPEGVSSTLGSTTTESEETSVSGQDELRLWNSVVEEAEQMQFSNTDDALLDHGTRKRFVSPLDARVEEADEDIHYFRTELLYQTGLSQEPNNPLLLANYAQFLYIVSNDYDRAEEYFKRAVEVEPKDAEALSKYATFLWRARDDLWAAEETFLEAIDADPTNSFYAANYANFLWNTGGDETCFPLDESQEDTI
ncbi:hypothetical protein Bca4012_033499 [Brassica carinata]|uniref:Uncharacterized protein n=3 Tax=Brassica TaxID=3705 RepID=A0A0D3C2X6_BRAOL|nr:PREDICTED: uncharacterized protein LOC106342655 [Brassica oleracea var. oleracea]KAG2285935.1 hypothetical protein Bca52824_045539 [Brassica carinata]CAF1864214.1 unnamed protein product [Brassica napus]